MGTDGLPAGDQLQPEAEQQSGGRGQDGRTVGVPACGTSGWGAGSPCTGVFLGTRSVPGVVGVGVSLP